MPQHDRLDLARVLLARAIEDETLVRKVSPDTDIADAIVGFHAQQAVEKLIKAVLAARGVAFMKSHALSYLVGLVEESKIEAPGCLFEADVLSPWAVEFRYEGEEPPALDRSGALTLVEQVRGWAESEIKALDPSPPPQQQLDQLQPR
ncbi:MAG TPA: HEPN domain-containing protein [Solirubrobacteraceae bacterium]|jgi:HEPN domain-containing protein|nr:HEPN domain-containing protein [Solirubrobacteraceae bacterium]